MDDVTRFSARYKQQFRDIVDAKPQTFIEHKVLAMPLIVTGRHLKGLGITDDQLCELERQILREVKETGE